MCAWTVCMRVLWVCSDWECLPAQNPSLCLPPPGIFSLTHGGSQRLQISLPPKMPSFASRGHTVKLQRPSGATMAEQNDPQLQNPAFWVAKEFGDHRGSTRSPKERSKNSGMDRPRAWAVCWGWVSAFSRAAAVFQPDHPSPGVWCSLAVVQKSGKF